MFVELTFTNGEKISVNVNDIKRFFNYVFTKKDFFTELQQQDNQAEQTKQELTKIVCSNNYCFYVTETYDDIRGALLRNEQLISCL